MANSSSCRVIWCVSILVSIWPRYVHNQQDGDVRLANGGQSSRGRVEVYDNFRWTTVCDDYWNNVDAMVVCRQLGYQTEGAIARYSAYYGMGTGYISLDNVQCFGNEEKLKYCPSSREPSNCKHTEDAGTECVPKEGDVRLVDGSSRDEGRVEILHDGQWGSICDSRWDDDDAAVVCRQVGFPTDQATAVYNAHFGRGSGRIALENVRCTGAETSLSLCLSSNWYPRSCVHSDDAGVICGLTEARSTPTSSVLIGALSSAGLIMVMVCVAIIVRIKRGNKLECSFGLCSRMRQFAGNLRNPLSFQEGAGQDTFEDSNPNEMATSTNPIGYPLSVQLNDYDRQPSLYSPNVDPHVHVTNISLNVNFENQQIMLFPPDGRISSPPPYSPSATDPQSNVPSGALMISPPPYSVLSTGDDHLSNQETHQMDSVAIAHDDSLVSPNSQRNRRVSDLQSPNIEQNGIMDLDSPENNAYRPPPYLPSVDHSPHHLTSSSNELNDDSDDDIAQDNARLPELHRDSIVSFNSIQTISPRNTEEPPPYSPWSVSTFV